MPHKPKPLTKKELMEEISVTESSLYPPSQFKPFNPNNLYRDRGNYSLYDKMRLDEQIKAVLTLKKRAVLSQGWKIR